MLVLREPERQYFTAPSAQELLDALRRLGAHCHEAYEDALKALELILEDLKGTISTLSQTALPDVTDLVELVYYLLLWPLKAVNAYFESWGNQNQAIAYTESWEALFLLLNEIKMMLKKSHGLKSWKEDVGPFKKGAAKKNKMKEKKEKVPALGVVELLLRIIAEKSTLTSIDTIHDAFRALRLVKLDCSKAKPGIPNAITVCTANNPDNGVSYAVITTTADRWDFIKKQPNQIAKSQAATSTNTPERLWDTYTPLSTFFRNARNSRHKAEPFKSHKKHIDYIDLQTRTLQHLYKHHATKPELLDWTPAYDHGKVILRPLTSPTFEYKSRCLRCQFLFHFNIEEKFRSIEISNRTDGNGHVNALMNCAETYAHFYCKYGFRSGELESPHNFRGNDWLRSQPLNRRAD